MIKELHTSILANVRLVLFLLSFLLPQANAFAQDGSLVSGFTTGSGTDKAIEKIVIQSDGKILVVGSFTSFNGTARDGIARLNSNGTLDGTFTPGTGAFGGIIQSVALHTNENIIIGGDFTKYNGTARRHIARLSSTGTLDATFSTNTGTAFNNGPVAVNAIAVQPDDNKIILGGDFSTFNGNARGSILRLNADGTLDGFTVPGLSGYIVKSLALQPDGKILIASYIGGGIRRVSSTGAIDNTLNVGTGAGQIPGPNNVIEDMLLQPDGKILIAGHFTTYDGTADNISNPTTTNRIARLNSDGTLDASFNPSGAGSNSYIYTMALQSDGKILIGGGFSQYNGINRMYIARLNSDGTLDTSFNPGTGAGGGTGGGFINAIALTSTGTAVIGGDFLTYNSVSNSNIVQVHSSSSNTLPVTWLYFKGNATKAGNQLSWATASEKDSRAFVIERSTDGINFDAIGEVAAAGNSNQEIRYSFSDKNCGATGAKTAYYRLKQIDFSGSFDYSRIIVLSSETSNAAQVAVYPNPFTNELQLEFANALAKPQTAQVILTSMEGKTVHTDQIKRTPGDFQITLKNLPELKQGIYLLKIIADGKVSVQKVTRQ